MILVLFKVVQLLNVVNFLCRQLNILFSFWIKVNISFLFWFVRALTRLCNHIYTVHPRIVLWWGPVYSLVGSKSDCFDVLGKFDFIIRWCAFVYMCVWGGRGKRARQGSAIQFISVRFLKFPGLTMLWFCILIQRVFTLSSDACFFLHLFWFD